MSTGVALELLGHDTTIFGKDFSYIDGEDVPTVASNYASASVYPVSVETQYDEATLVERCEATFRPFAATDGVPVRSQRHFYMYEEETAEAIPPRMDAEPLDEYRGVVPSRTGGRVVDGYTCREYMVEMPEYMPALYEVYQELGGVTRERTVEPGEPASLPGAYTINCSGYGSRRLFADESMRAMKGHILQVPYEHETPLEFSYVYSPSDYDGYAYMYPRKDSVVFDGSYLVGDIVDGTWEGEAVSRPVALDGERVPERLVVVNEEIMNDYVDFDRGDIAVKYGYRPYRERGLRIESDGEIVHNYGHGGAGVSLSWTSAIDAIGLIDTVPEDITNRVARRMGELAESTA
jgi:D-amino-acid oxidase